MSKGATYSVELCSGEHRQWRYLGDGEAEGPGEEDVRGRWWQDVETGLVFNEASLMYAWTLLETAVATESVRRPETGDAHAA